MAIRKSHISTDEELESHAGAEYPESTGYISPDGTSSVIPGMEKNPSEGRTKPQRHRKKKSGHVSVNSLVDGVLSGDRVTLGRAITLIESAKPEDSIRAMELIQRILPHTGTAVRVGITGVPGVGKSTFIETLGGLLTKRGHRLAVLAIDPSSSRSGGSIMGDKTRMEYLGRDEKAFIRPSPSAGSLGGVARKTREAMLLCEAAGFDIVFVETVGVGQSETLVHSMVDFFLLLLLPNAGDQLQGIKRGIMELADAVAINKADGDNAAPAMRAKTEYETALHLMAYPFPEWTPPVRICSALTGEGIAELWDVVVDFHKRMSDAGHLAGKRREQSRSWMFDTIRQSLLDRFIEHPAIARILPEYESRVRDGAMPALEAAQRLLDLYSRQDGLSPENKG
jgi:LAO/AO transport system kinase